MQGSVAFHNHVK